MSPAGLVVLMAVDLVDAGKEQRSRFHAAMNDLGWDRPQGVECAYVADGQQRSEMEIVAKAAEDVKEAAARAGMAVPAAACLVSMATWHTVQ